MNNVKEIVTTSKTSRFVKYRKGFLWYVTDNGFEFPVPVEDTGDADFLAEDRTMMFMRYIRKHLEDINEGRSNQA